MIILTDSREQKPYNFSSPTEVTGLSVGDYSVKGLEDYISIERKSSQDLLLSLTSERDRFTRELYRGRALDYFCLVLECSLSDLVNGNYRSQMNPKSAVQSLLAFSVRFKLPIFFCENREYGARVTESLLLKYSREIERKHQALSNGAGKDISSNEIT